MTISAMVASGNGEERDMTRNQWCLVDTCFEEGQYESGVALLDQLRSAKYRPTVSHIHQLLYIALYPPQPIALTSGQAQGQDFASSLKHRQQQQKTTLVPSCAASQAAQRVFLSFIITNSPQSICRALPQYYDSSASGPRGWDNIDEDSALAKNARSIGNSRSCWAILKEGFIQPQQLVSFTPKKKGRRRRDDFDEHDFDSYVDGASPAIVAEHAWPVLDSLIRLFEKDETLTERAGTVRYSPLLCTQLPPPKSGAGLRWEIDAPLDIAWSCFQQKCTRRRSIGTRLLTLLINLWSASQLDLNIFVASVATRLSSFTPPEFRNVFVAGLPPTVSVLAFKIALYRQFLSQRTSNALSAGRPTSRARPQARATRLDGEARDADINLVNVVNPLTAGQPGSCSSSELLHLLKQDLDMQSKPVMLYVKYDLVLAYGSLQNQLAEDKKDSVWKALLISKELIQIIESAFVGHQEASIYKGALLAVMNTWAAWADNM